MPPPKTAPTDPAAPPDAPAPGSPEAEAAERFAAARGRITQAVAGKAGHVERVELDDAGAPVVVVEQGLAPVLAGDVVALVAGLGGRATQLARELAAGAGAVKPDKVVFQRADQLRAVLALAGA